MFLVRYPTVQVEAGSKTFRRIRRSWIDENIQ